MCSPQIVNLVLGVKTGWQQNQAKVNWQWNKEPPLRDVDSRGGGGGGEVTEMWRHRRNQLWRCSLWFLWLLVYVVGRVTLTCSFSPQSFNAPPRSKMKLWKGATFAFMLCGAALSILLVRNMAAVGQFRPKTKYPHTSSSSSRASSSSGSTPRTSLPPAVLSRQMGGSHRRTRSADNVNSLLTDCKINTFFSSLLPDQVSCEEVAGVQAEHLVPDCCLENRF